ncbi:hypothetical protein HOLleu_18846 [Holothuria leucospilota]|uniref:Uncharacterized protein n=1 Tax=Holothuria leucospilota TaxID=206669 RepID=A0A9Q1H9F6_HOLLE|nr:hypothetical protein HOLleu_18846 [Holothuria leucospilota]
MIPNGVHKHWSLRPGSGDGSPPPRKCLTNRILSEDSQKEPLIFEETLLNVRFHTGGSNGGAGSLTSWISPLTVDPTSAARGVNRVNRR